MVDVPSIETRLQRLGDLIAELEEIASAGRDAYETDFRTQLAAQHALQQAIQICIDIGAHVIAERGLTLPPDYRGVFGELRAAGLDPDVAARLSNAAGMRNILVHGYLDVDDDVIWNALFELDDLRRFAAMVTRLLTEDEGPENPT